jgi:hypothetical protein
MSFEARYCTWRVAKTAGREALHRTAARQQRSLRQGYWTPLPAAQPITVVAGLQTTGGIRSSVTPCAAIGKPDCGVCSAAVRH